MVRRGLYHARPPPLRTKDDMHPTLLISWWCTGFALVIILVRVGGRYARTEKLFREDKIMAASIIPLMIRMALVHVILIWGTNNTVTEGLSALDVRHREIGSKLVLVSRIIYAAFIWTAKLTVLEFLKRIIGAHWRRSYEIGLQIVRYFLLATFVAVIVATLTECKPFSRYWQVIPDPGPQCRQGVAQLLTMATCDIVTDLLLVVYPVPIVTMSSLPTKRKVSLVLLFALSLTLVALTAYRIPSTVRRGNAQPYRSLLASLEILAAAAVSNSIVIGSFIRDRGLKKPKYRRESTGGVESLESTMARRATVTQHHWGSDSDLVSDVCFRLAPDLQSWTSSRTCSQLGPMPPSSISMGEKGGIARRSMEGDASSISTTDLKRDPGHPETSAAAATQPATPQKMSFFDVGSLMQSEEKESLSPCSNIPPDLSRPSSSRDFANPPASPQIQSAPNQPESDHPRLVFADVGGLLSDTRSSTDLDRSTAPPPAARQRAPSQHKQPAPSLPPLSRHNLGRCDSGTSQRPTPTSPPPPPPPPPPPLPPPPSYRPRRESETAEWNGAGPACSMEIVDAGGLLR